MSLKDSDSLVIPLVVNNAWMMILVKFAELAFSITFSKGIKIEIWNHSSMEYECKLGNQLWLYINTCNFIICDGTIICCFHNFCNGCLDNVMDYFNHGPTNIITLVLLWKIIWRNSNKPFMLSYSSRAFSHRVGRNFWQIEWFSSSDLHVPNLA